MEIERIHYCFSVCKVKDYSLVDLNDAYCFIEKAEEENALVCLTEHVPENVTAREDGWKAFRVRGMLDFSLIGILAKLAALLAEHQISIFALSTYNTDYILVKEEHYEQALKILSNAGYQIV